MAGSRLGWWVAAAALLPIGGAVAARYERYAAGVELGALLLALNLAALGGTLLLIGKALTGDPFGFALGGLNRYSLARAQAALWTVVVFAILLTAAEWNLALPLGGLTTEEVKGPLDLVIPPALLTALGISLFSAVAAPALVTVRGDATPAATGAQLAAASDRTLALTGKVPDLQARGQVVSNKDARSASWQELLTGDEVGQAAQVDLSKVQQALLTLIIVSIYVAAFMATLTKGAWLEFPPLGGDAVRLLAISHAGYLAYKVVPKPDAPAADGLQVRSTPQMAGMGPKAAE